MGNCSCAISTSFRFSSFGGKAIRYGERRLLRGDSVGVLRNYTCFLSDLHGGESLRAERVSSIF